MSEGIKNKVLSVQKKLICFGFEVLEHLPMAPSVAEWIKASEYDASAGGGSPVRAPVRAATLCPYV